VGKDHEGGPHGAQNDLLKTRGSTGKNLQNLHTGGREKPLNYQLERNTHTAKLMYKGGGTKLTTKQHTPSEN